MVEVLTICKTIEISVLKYQVDNQKKPDELLDFVLVW